MTTPHDSGLYAEDRPSAIARARDLAILCQALTETEQDARTQLNRDRCENLISAALSNLEDLFNLPSPDTEGSAR